MRPWRRRRSRTRPRRCNRCGRSTRAHRRSRSFRQGEPPELAERQLGERLQRVLGPRALEGDEPRLRRGVDHVAPADDVLEEPGAVLLQRRRVDHDQVVVGGDPVDDEVVDDAAGRQAGDRVERPPVGERPDVVRHEPLDRLGGAAAPEVDLPHVADVEHTDRLAGGPVLVEDAAGVADRHRPAAEVDHLRAQAKVGIVKRCALHGAATSWKKRRANSSEAPRAPPSRAGAARAAKKPSPK